MNLYEVIRWGNDLDDPIRGGPDGPDTCYLVRAESPDQAAVLADRDLAAQGQDWASVVYLLGVDAGTELQARILRGPYLQHAYCHGWRRWSRKAQTDPWIEGP